MITALRLLGHSHFRQGVVGIVLVSWLALLLAATCAMTAPIPTAARSDSACMDSGRHIPDHTRHHPAPDCPVKVEPCLQAQSLSGLALGTASPDLPVAVLYLICLLGLGPLAVPPRRIARASDPPIGTRVPLFYRFCTLLN